MHSAWLLMKITVSELKQPWSVLLWRKNSALFRAWTAIIRSENLIITEDYWRSLNTYENLWTLLKMSENRWISMKIPGHLWKCLKVAEHLGKTLIVSENVWRLLKTSENYFFNSGTVWTPLLALFIADWSSTYVLSTFYELHLRKTPKKRKIY